MELAWNHPDNSHCPQLIERGHTVERSIAEKLRALGIIVHEPPKSVRAHYDDRAVHRDGTDLYAWSTSIERWVRVSVKERSEVFTSAKDFPYDTIFVDTKEKLDEFRPEVVVCPCEHNDTVIWTYPERYRDAIVVSRRFDRVRKGEYNFAELHRSWWYDGLESLADALRR